MTLAEFVQREAALPSYDGACCRFVDNWIRERTGFSALARFGRDFACQSEVDAWLAERGGIAVGVNRVMRAGGFPKTKHPQDGDVGLVFHRRGSVEQVMCVAILVGGVWLVRDDSGMAGVPYAQFWKAWSLAER